MAAEERSIYQEIAAHREDQPHCGKAKSTSLPSLN
jgi:hypothetical protein